MDYGPTLLPRLGADQPQHDNASDQPSSLSDEPTKVASARPKNHSHSHKKHDTEPRSISIRIQVNPMSLGLHHLDLKNMLIEANTK